jgi:predicted aconitase
MAEDGKVKVKTTLNPAGMDVENWERLGIDPEFARKQKLVIEAFERMGVEATCTCTPYFIGNRPEFGDHVAWGESSAVTYANSVLGAKTNREGGPSTIASALTGLTPEYGFHLEENRQANFVAEVKARIDNPMLFGALGNVIGKIAKGRVPFITGIRKATTEDLKALSASIVTYGSAPLFHIEGITTNKTKIPEEKISITQEDIENAIREMNDTDDVEFIFIGCPHCTLKELERISELLKGKNVRKELWVGVARRIKKMADGRGYSKIIEDSGAKFACDTCHVVAPLKGRFSSIATDSAKGIFYGRGKNNFKTFFGTLEDCIRLAVKE